MISQYHTPCYFVKEWNLPSEAFHPRHEIHDRETPLENLATSYSQYGDNLDSDVGTQGSGLLATNTGGWGILASGRHFIYGSNGIK